MILDSPQIKIIKKLFYLALILFILVLLKTYILQGLLSLESNNLGYRIIDTLIYSINSVVFWYLIGKFTKDRTAALYAIGITILITSALLIISIDNDNIFLKSIVGSLAFLAFGIAHHKSIKGLLYVIPFLIFQGLDLGDLYFIHVRADRILSIIDLDGILQLEIPSRPDSSSHIIYYPIANIISFSQIIIQYILMIQFYLILNKKNWNDFMLRRVSLIKIDKFSFSIIFWVSRFIIMSLIFAFVYNTYSLNRSSISNSMMYLWLPSIALATFVFLSFYRNFLVSYFISKNLLPGWRYLFLNIPVINFFIWLHLLLTKETKEDKPSIATDEEIKKQFGYADNNDNIKIVLVFAIIIPTLLKYFNFNGSDNEALLLIANGVVSLIILGAYFYSSKFYFPLLLVSVLALFSLPFLNTIETYPLIMASIINLILWYPLFHLNKMTFEQQHL